MTGKWRTGSGKKGQDGANEKDQGIGKDWDTNHILDRLPLEKRLNLMTFIIIIPLAVLVIYLMATVAKFCNAYTQSIANITQANSVTANLREDVDYSMYRIVIGMRTYQSIHELMEEDRPYGWEQIKDPHQTISDARKTYRQLLKRTPEGANRTRINWLLHCLDQLEQRVDEIEDNLPHGMYDKNMEILDYGVRVLTADIEKQGREYVYYETLHVQEIQKELESQEHTAIVVSLTLLVSILIISLLLSRRITKSVTVPIQKLCNETERVAKGDFTSGPKIEAGDELAILTGSFDHMKEEIGRLIEDIRQEQNQRRVMELQLLQEQINPHFLYNTLDSVIWMTENGRTEDAVVMLTSLARFFRISLSRGSNIITVAEELEHARHYLTIQKMRYKNKFSADISAADGVESLYTIKLIVQPILENAIYHGMDYADGDGRICIQAFREREDVIIEVADNGPGMPEEVVERLLDQGGAYASADTKGSGIGLRNVHRRIQLTFGRAYGLTIFSEPDDGTVVRIRLPALDEEESRRYRKEGGS